MAVRPIILERIPNSGDVVMISNSGISFSASFIKSKELHTMVSVGFFIDDKDQYKLLFKFYKEEGLPNTLVLLKQGRGGVSNGRTVKAQEVFSKNRVLSSIQKLKNKHCFFQYDVLILILLNFQKYSHLDFHSIFVLVMFYQIFLQI